MNCQEFWNTMPELACDQDRLVHLRDCLACAQRLERQRRLAAGLRTIAAEWSQVEAPARVEARLIAAFRSHAGLGHSGRAMFRPPRVWLPVATWLAAAAAVVALAIALVSGRQPKPAHQSVPSGSEWAFAQVPGELGTGDDSPYNDADFIPLPNAERISPNEDVNLVRVEVPRSTMIALGYDVSADRASEAVEAEVVLGADGLARAVRFLDE
ncbi:MAG: hypothetical protein LAQ69_24565 [Acidobacteriia bacterium]|nr:hypothetical protein [Terriglobia bacterium]